MHRYLPIFSAVVIGWLIRSIAGECALSLHGNAHVGLSETSSIFTRQVDRSEYTFEMWFTPSRHVMREQSLIQTGIVVDVLGEWAVDISFEPTIWSQSEIAPSVSVIYVDVWAKKDAQWIKTRYYTVLGGESFPWAHVSFSVSTSIITVTNKTQRMNKNAPKMLDNAPRAEFALGYGFDGIIDDLRIWSGEKQDSTLCPDAESPLELYIPFRECSGDVFAGHSYNTTVCTVTYGDYSWAHSSPVPHPECTTQAVPADACKDSKRATPSSLDSSLNTNAQPPVLPVVGVVGVLGCAALVLAYSRRQAATAAQQYSRLSHV